MAATEKNVQFILLSKVLNFIQLYTENLRHAQDCARLFRTLKEYYVN